MSLLESASERWRDGRLGAWNGMGRLGFNGSTVKEFMSCSSNLMGYKNRRFVCETAADTSQTRGQ